MEFIESGFIVISLIILSSLFLLSFIDRDSMSKKGKRQKIKSHTKILTQDGMVAKKSDTGPLFLIGDSKSIR
jgi:hypothetical protein